MLEACLTVQTTGLAKETDHDRRHPTPEEPLYVRSTLPEKQQEEKATPALAAPLGLTHQDRGHDADVLGILPEHTAKGDFGKMSQSAKEHQEAQHLDQRSDLRREGA